MMLSGRLFAGSPLVRRRASRVVLAAAQLSEAAARLAELLGVEVARTPGTHFPYLDHPQELAQTVRPFLRRVSP